MTQSAATDISPETTKDKVVKTADMVKSKSKKAAAAAAETAQQSVETAQEVVADTVEKTTDEFQKLAHSGKQFVRENPGTAIAGAIGVGILLGLALRGRD